MPGSTSTSIRSRRRGLRASILLALLAIACGGRGEVGRADPFDDAKSWAFDYREHPAPPNQPRLDLRSMNEPVAGQSGFVKRSADGSGFARGDGAPIRFWAVNSAVFRQDPDSIDRNVRFLARMGVNMVRLHAQITPKGDGAAIGSVDEKEIDGIWRYVAAAKKQGIYTTVSPYWANSVDAAGWGIPGYGKGELYGVLFLDETLQKAYKGWTRALLARPNPYTGVPLAKDPALSIIQVQNEDSLMFWTTMNIKAPMKAKLAAGFTAWSVAKHGSAAKAIQAWDGATLPGDNPAANQLGVTDVFQMTQRQPGGLGKRVGDQVAYFAEAQRKFYDAMGDYFRKDLGCGQLVNATNWRTADDIRLGDAERWSYSGLDVIAANRYYDGVVHQGPNAGWRVDPGDKFSQTSALTNPRGLPFNLKQVAGRPMVVTESTWPAPSGLSSEGPFLAAVYPSLTGVDAVYWFDDDTPEYNLSPFFPYQKVNGQEPILKYPMMTPSILGGFPAASLAFRLGYIKQGEPVVHEERPMAALWDRSDPILAEGPTFDPNRDAGSGGRSDRRAGPVDPLAFLAGPVEVNYGGDPARTRVSPDLGKLIDPARKVVRSVTGEITLDYGKGVCTVDAPRAQGACGNLGAAGPIKLRDVSVDVASPFAALLVVPLDEKPIAESKRLLVQVTTTARPTGFATRPAEFLADDKKTRIKGFEITRTGKPPWLVADTEVGLAIRNPNLARATQLDPALVPVETVPIKKTRTGATLTMPPDAMYLILE